MRIKVSTSTSRTESLRYFWKITMLNAKKLVTQNPTTPNARNRYCITSICSPDSPIVSVAPYLNFDSFTGREVKYFTLVGRHLPPVLPSSHQLAIMGGKGIVGSCGIEWRRASWRQDKHDLWIAHQENPHLHVSVSPLHFFLPSIWSWEARNGKKCKFRKQADRILLQTEWRMQGNTQYPEFMLMNFLLELIERVRTS